MFKLVMFEKGDPQPTTFSNSTGTLESFEKIIEDRVGDGVESVVLCLETNRIAFHGRRTFVLIEE